MPSATASDASARSRRKSASQSTALFVGSGISKSSVFITDAVLNHVSGSRVGVFGIYRCQDTAAKKQAALSAWGKHSR